MTTHAFPRVSTEVTASGTPYSVPTPARIVHAPGAVASLRMFSSLAWILSATYGKDAKLAPSFLSGAGLSERIHETFVHSAVAPVVADFLTGTVAPHAQLFAIMIGFGDLAIGISLALGLFSKVGGAAAIFRAATNILIAGKMGMDTIGFNSLLIFAGVVVIATGAGRRWGLDAELRRRYPSSRFLRILT